jgi:hypothetical protein
VLAENGEAFADVGDVGVGVRLVGVAEDGGGLSGQGGNESRELADNARVWRSEPRHLRRLGSRLGDQRQHRSGCQQLNSACHVNLLGRDVLALSEAADLAWILRTCPSCGNGRTGGRPRGFRLGFLEVCGSAGQ